MIPPYFGFHLVKIRSVTELCCYILYLETVKENEREGGRTAQRTS